ncbi:uncharacterized protein A4U43_C10F8460 [Asparagus officinalis]|uniref:Uncharacterized protein n=2 Tax=Asparagus officinalis TaxID=4686 RepID=A0A5P1E1F8_ASPOF|nr:uncharacterized protein A4U43_C10F8460 [Asparagus officinalis]
MNMDNNLLDLPCPAVDYFEIDMKLSKKFIETARVSDIPFQMFCYRVIERERCSLYLKEKSSDSGSEGTSTYGDDSGFNMMIHDDSFVSPLPLRRSSSQMCLDVGSKSSPRKIDKKAVKQSGQTPKGRTKRPPPLLNLRGRSLNLKSYSQLTPPATMTPGRRRISGHKSDSELA